MRHAGWVEVLVSRGDERWLGRGLDEDAALADALRQMAPSALAQALIAQALSGLAEAAPSGASESSGAAAREAAPVAVPVDAGASESPRPAPSEGASSSPSPLSSSMPSPAASPSEAVVEPAPAVVLPLVVAADNADGPRLKRAPAPPSPAIPLRKIDEDLAELEVLDERLKFMLPDLAALSRDLQRMGFIAFIARARHIAARAGDSRVEKLVQRIASRLGELAQQLWPGSVRALQLKATPLQAGADLGMPSGGKLHDWAEAAEAAERLI
ncbi:MAG: hypothetical protein U1F43_27165 [Myxococcota bacterium]